MLSSHGIRLDLVFAALPAERDLWARAQPKQLGGHSIELTWSRGLRSYHKHLPVRTYWICFSRISGNRKRELRWLARQQSGMRGSELETAIALE